MREILFRGKSKAYNEWLISECIGSYVSNDGIKHIDLWVNNSGWFEVIPETVSQFTGLLDRHGKRLFEKDIVKNKNNGIFVVEWLNNDYYFGYYITDADGLALLSKDYIQRNDIEIIGNQFDTPELLKEQP